MQVRGGGGGYFSFISATSRAFGNSGQVKSTSMSTSTRSHTHQDGKNVGRPQCRFASGSGISKPVCFSSDQETALNLSRLVLAGVGAFVSFRFVSVWLVIQTGFWLRRNPACLAESSSRLPTALLFVTREVSREFQIRQLHGASANDSSEADGSTIDPAPHV